jgi:hypothetical protein
MGVNNKVKTEIRVIAVIVLAAGAVMATAACTRASNSPYSAPAGLVSATPTVFASSPPAVSTGDDGGIYTPGPTLSAAPPKAVTAAAEFARIWARPTIPATTWYTDIARWCEPSLAEKLRTTDPSLIPATTITGRPRPVGQIRAEALSLAINTDTGVLTVGLVGGPNQWLVVSIDFTRDVHQ